MIDQEPVTSLLERMVTSNTGQFGAALVSLTAFAYINFKLIIRPSLEWIVSILTLGADISGKLRDAAKDLRILSGPSKEIKEP